MSFDYDDYQRLTARTQLSSSTSYEYLAGGLISECGEVVGKLKKVIRDSNAEIDHNHAAKLRSELGDVCWYVARLGAHYNMKMSEIMTYVNSYRDLHPVLLPVRHKDIHTIGRQLVRIACTVDDVGPAVLPRVLMLVEAMCEIIGTDLPTIMLENLVKTQDRNARNVTTGDGDDR